MTGRSILQPRFTSSIADVPIVPGQFIATSDGNLYVDMESGRIHYASFTVVSTMTELKAMAKDIAKLYCVDDSLWRWDGNSLVPLGGIAGVIKSGRQEFSFPETLDGRFLVTYTYTGDDPATTEINVGTMKPLLEVVFELVTTPQEHIPDSLADVMYFNNFIKALRDCDIQSFIFNLEGANVRDTSETEVELVQDGHLSAIAGKFENVTTLWRADDPASAEFKGIWVRSNHENGDELFYRRFYVEETTVKHILSPLIKDAPHDDKLYGRKNGRWEEIPTLHWIVDTP